MFENAADPERASNPQANATLKGSRVLGMPELARTGLSENWMLKMLGDRHWRLIANAAGQSKASFRDRSGRDVYAAFCALSVSADGFERPDLDDRLDIASSLYRVSSARLASQHVLTIGYREVARVCLVSTFVSRQRAGENRSVARVDFPGLPALPALPADLAFPRRAATLARQGADGHFGLRIDAASAASAAEADYIFTPCPSLDFNRAGLLYFPSFIAAAERALSQRLGPHAHEYVLAKRDVLFSGNVDLHEPISVRIADLQPARTGLKSALILSGPGDRPLCQVFCEYRKPAAED